MDDVKNYTIKYCGSIFWVVVLLIFFLPAGILLLASGIRIKKENEFWGLSYNGSMGWLIFWTILFFPVAIILAIINGSDMVRYSE